ncbi:MAG: hypothetical protein R3E10_16270 [Gemmatimonadota bacterium]
MLNSVFQPGERIAGSPAAAFWRGVLWLAYRNLQDVLTLRSVSVLSTPVGSQTKLLPFAAPTALALAAWNDRLWLAFSDENGEAQLTSSADGFSFTPPVSLGFLTHWRLALAGTDQGLWLLWSENTGAVHLWRSVDGTAFEDVGLTLQTRTAPALAFDEENRRLGLLWAERGGPGRISVGLLDVDDPDPAVPWQAAIEGAPCLGVSAAFVGGHGGRRVLVASERDAPGPGGLEVEGHTVPFNLSSIGEVERFTGGQVHGLSLASSGTRVWAAWRGAFQDDLFVAPWDIAFDLPENLRQLLGTDCDPRACPPDPRLVCAATETEIWTWTPPHIQNANRGDLVVTPADGAGIIGTLLGSTSPPQSYDHNGIMIEDQFVIRHATAAHDRLKQEKFYTGSVLGEPAPTDGFRPDLLKYGWPGTITQTIDDAFFTGFNSSVPGPLSPPFAKLNPRWDYYTRNPTAAVLPKPPDGSPPEAWTGFNERRLFFDPERPGDGYSIHNFPSGPAYRMDLEKLVYGVVLKPHPDVEAMDPAVRQTLHRVADAAIAIDGHYRFYAYTRARIGVESQWRAPPPGHSEWSGLPVGADWAAGSAPLVCSSFIWAAVRRASATLPLLELEGEATESPEELLPTPVEDGLYRYTEAERKAAAEALFSYTSGSVRREVREKLMTMTDEYAWLVGLGKIGLSALVVLLQGPAAIAAAVLGCTEGQVTDLALLFNDMPDQVANQMCNVFASDNAADTESDAWRTPGSGVAVSPDDMLRFWDPPSPSQHARIRHGLWGYTERMLLLGWRVEPGLKHVLERSAGVARVTGRVLYGDAEVVGAEVRIGCDKDLTRPSGHGTTYVLEVGTGRQEVVAGVYWPATQWWLSARQVVKLVPGEQVVDLRLEDPPEWRRTVRVYGKVDIVRRVLFGSDDWHHQPISLEVELAWLPASWGQPPSGAANISHTFPWMSGMAGNVRMNMSVAVWLKADLSLGVGVSVQMLKDYFGDDDDPIWEHVETGTNQSLTVARDGSATLTVDQKSAAWPPDRIHLELTIANERAPA